MEKPELEALVEELLGLGPAQRESVLVRACGDDETIRRRVLERLAERAQASQSPAGPDAPVEITLDSESQGNIDGQLAHTKTSMGTSDSEDATETREHVVAPADGMQLSNYRLQKKLGEGGMGEVWLAQQREPVKRNVALKLIKKGIDSSSVLARFDQERQALAIMDHPNIASVYDGGVSPSGQPYFVMELVQGRPLIEFADEHRLSPTERLELFVPICRAIQHAHQKGIVHRDLKPANILVSMVDGRPVPKVIDFGVAKATGGKLTNQALTTQMGAVVGTLEYMSPEQAGQGDLDIDTRSDIYSLGVVLYELLTGLRPIESERLQQAGLAEMIRIIQEEEPSKPSTRLSTNESLPSLAAIRNVEPKKLTALLRGELDWVVMKCLEKSRDRRYESADALARDLQRYLSNEPVEARPPSSAYRIRKFLKRNQVAATAASLVIVASTIGAAGTVVGLLRAQRAEARALEKAEEADIARLSESRRADSERLAKQSAERRLQQLDKGNELLGAVFDDLNIEEITESEEPLQAVLASRLVEAAQQLQADSIGDATVVARMQLRLGKALRSLGYPEDAIPLIDAANGSLEKSFGADSIEVLYGRSQLASLYQDAGDIQTALPIFESLLGDWKSKSGTADQNTIEAMQNLAYAHADAGQDRVAIPLYEEALELAKDNLGPDSSLTLTIMSNLALAYARDGKPDVATPMLEQVLETRSAQLGEDHPDTLISLNNLANHYRNEGNSKSAVPLLRHVLQVRTIAQGGSHPATLRSMNNLAVGLARAEKIDEALLVYEQVIQLRRATLGAGHPSTLTSMHNLGSFHLTAQKPELAVPLLQDTWERRKLTLGPDHKDTLRTLSLLGSAHRANGSTELAIEVLRQVLQLQQESLGNSHRLVLVTMNNLATSLQRDKQFDEAISIFEETLKLRRETLGETNIYTLASMNNLAFCLKQAGQFERAIQQNQETLALYKEHFGPEHSGTLTTSWNLARVYEAAGQLDLAFPLFEKTLRTREEVFGAAHYEVINGHYNLANTYCAAGRSDQSVAHFEAYLDTKRSQKPMDLANLAGWLDHVADILIEAEEYAASEDLLRECYAIREKIKPNSWYTFAVYSKLGGVLISQQRLDEAEPILLAAYEGIRARSEGLSDSGQEELTQAIQRLAQLYDQQDAPEKAQTFRELIEKRAAGQ